jgi:hypothetical protein
MQFVNDYSMAFWGILTIILTLIVQQLIASKSKASQSVAIPGKIDES